MSRPTSNQGDRNGSAAADRVPPVAHRVAQPGPRALQRRRGAGVIPRAVDRPRGPEAPPADAPAFPLGPDPPHPRQQGTTNMTPRQVEIVQDNFKKVSPIAEVAAGLFYARLFELDPAPRKLFKGEAKTQGM